MEMKVRRVEANKEITKRKKLKANRKRERNKWKRERKKCGRLQRMNGLEKKEKNRKESK